MGCSLKPGACGEGGVKWQILVRKLALPSLRELRDESCLNVPFHRPRRTSSIPPATSPRKTPRFSVTYTEETSKPCSPPSSPIQFRLGEVTLPSTRWLKLQQQISHSLRARARGRLCTCEGTRHWDQEREREGRGGNCSS